MPCPTAPRLTASARRSVASEVPLEIGAVRASFARLHGRRVVGKEVIRVAPDPSKVL
jgi:hypothetical protein